MDQEFYETMKPTFRTPENDAACETIDADPYAAVPAVLKAMPQWVLWKKETRGGKETKIPYQSNGAKAKTNDSVTWTDYPSVIAAERTGNFSGIGFVFTEEDDLTGIDLDNCIRDGKVQPWAQDILNTFTPIAYCEVSPSKNGIKLWTRGELPNLTKHKVYINQETGEAIEVYDKGRYFTVTGKGKHEIGDGQEAVEWLFELMHAHQPKGAAKKVAPETTPTPTPTPNRTDTRNTADIIALIESSKQHAKFTALMRGNTTGYGSQSEADLGLVGIIAFYTQDTAQIDAIFRQSKLYRSKWDEKHREVDGATYGQMTIEKALSDCRETYTPPRRRRKRDNFYQRRAKRRRYKW